MAARSKYKFVPVCPHTGEELHHDPRLGSEFAVSTEGNVYYLKARPSAYGPDYFLEEYRNQYGRTYIEDEPHLRELARRRLRRIRRYIKPPARILEIGCAAGFFLDEARSLTYETEGLDVSSYAVDYAVDILGLDVHCSSFPNTNLRGPYDIIAAYYALEHFPNQKTVFQAIAGLLRPGGIVSFAIPSLNGPLFQFDIEEWVRSHPIDHFADYSPRGMSRIVSRYGLGMREIGPASFRPERWRGRLPLERWPLLYKCRAIVLNYGDTMEGIIQKTFK